MPLRKPALIALTVIAALISWSAGAVFPISASASSTRGLLPPDNPPKALAVLEYLWPQCTSTEDYSQSCLQGSLAMLNAGRVSEQLGPVMLPANWSQLTVPQQLFTLTELERTARGLPADTGLAADWDAAAQTGAEAGQDPTRGGSGANGFRAVWAGGQPNPIVVLADWVYADGAFPNGDSQNLGCTGSDQSRCWSHRDAVLHDTASAACASRCAMGAGFSAEGYSAGQLGRRESYTEIFSIDGANNPDPLDFTWASERQQLPSCERGGDSCSWIGIPVATASGIRDVHNGRRSTAGSSQPSFAVHLTGHVSRNGHVTLLIRTGVRLLGISAVARLGSHHVALRVRRRTKFLYRATGTLSRGRWTVTIRYRQTRSRRVHPTSKLRLTAADSRRRGAVRRLWRRTTCRKGCDERRLASPGHLPDDRNRGQPQRAAARRRVPARAAGHGR
jgi:hypothetical protein